MRSILMMRMRKCVDDFQDEEDFRLKDEFIEDSTEPKKSPCEEDEYYAKYFKDLKGHKLAQHEGVKSSFNQCYTYSIF